MLKATLIIFLSFAGLVLAQPDTLWSRLFEGEGTLHCNSTICTNDGGFLLGGFQYSLEFSYDFFVIKTNSEGDPEWTTRLTDEWGSGLGSITQTADRNYFLVGSGSSHNDGAAIIAKISSDGDSLWMRHYGGLLAKLNSSVPNGSGGVYVAGTTSDSARFGSYDGYLVNIDEDGEELWHRVYGGRSTDWFRDMVRTSDGGFAFAGETLSFGNSLQFYLVKTDSTGEEEWSATYGDSLAEVGFKLIQTSDDGYALGGWIYQEAVGLTTDMMIVRVDAEGNEMWTRRFGHEMFSERCNDLIQTGDGGFVLAGQTGRTADIYLIRTDEFGDTLWTTTYNVERSEECYTIIHLEDDSYILTGHTSRNNMFMLRTEPDPANAVWEVNPAFPSMFIVNPAYPNPFNSTTSIAYNLPAPERVTVKIFDLSGRKVATLVDGRLNAGNHHVYWNGLNTPSGIYVCRMEAGSFTKSIKLALVR